MNVKKWFLVFTTILFALGLIVYFTTPWLQVNCGYEVSVVDSIDSFENTRMPSIILRSINKDVKLVVAGAHSPLFSPDCEYLAFANLANGLNAVSIFQLRYNQFVRSEYLIPNIRFSWSEKSDGVFYSDINIPSEEPKFLVTP